MKSDAPYCERRLTRFNKKTDSLDNARRAENDQQIASGHFSPFTRTGL